MITPKRVGLYFGSFNPIHIGHLIVANSVLEIETIDEVWFVVSPHNPHKEKKVLINEIQRFEMVQLSIKENPLLFACDIEFKLAQPSYTVDTLKHLIEKHSNCVFSLLMGADNLIYFEKWKKPFDILSLVDLFVYNRQTKLKIPTKWLNHKKINFLDFDLINISSTVIRNKRKKNKSIKYWVKPEVESYILEHDLYL